VGRGSVLLECSNIRGNSGPSEQNFFKTLQKVTSYHAYHNWIIKH